jgi:trehalose-phosphatase
VQALAHSFPVIQQKLFKMILQKEELKKLLGEKAPVLFLDYDGTLTPIVKRPEDAIISDGMKTVLQECAKKFKVAVVSGRDMDDLKSKVGIDNLIYAGSHGFRISGPGGLYNEHEKTSEIIPELDKIEKLIQNAFREIDKGIQIDKKRYAIGVHYRNAKEENVPAIIDKVKEVVGDFPAFKTGEGKKIIEVKPDVDWHKGKALRWIMEKLGAADKNKFIPIYIGDDITDEDGFAAIENFGIGILVGQHGKPTAAKFRLKDVTQVKEFLIKLAKTVN